MSHIESPKNVFVTGAGGLIGSAICRILSPKGTRVRALLAPNEPEKNLEGLEGIDIIHGDVRDRALMMSLAEGTDAVIHTAALNKLWHRPSKDFHSINVGGTLNLCLAALNAKAKRFVYTSSCEVFGPAVPKQPADEDRKLLPSRVRGHYELSKLHAETVVTDFAKRGLAAVIIRPTAVMGPGDIHGTPPGRMVKAFLEGGIPAYYNAGINIADSRDVAAAHIAALTEGRIGQAYIVGGTNIFLDELFNIMGRTTGSNARRKKVGYGVALSAAILAWARSLVTRRDPGITINGIRTLRYSWFFDTTKAKRDLGLKPRPIEETIQDTIEWMRSSQQ